MNNRIINKETGRTSSRRAPVAVTRLVEQEKERLRRRDLHEEDALAHDRRTKSSRAKFASFCERKIRYNKITDDAEARIAALRAEMEVLEQKKGEMEEKLGELEEKEGETAGEGERDAEISEKYRAFLEMESEELGL